MSFWAVFITVMRARRPRTTASPTSYEKDSAGKHEAVKLVPSVDIYVAKSDAQETDIMRRLKPRAYMVRFPKGICAHLRMEATACAYRSDAVMP
jgi:hypothetical protein